MKSMFKGFVALTAGLLFAGPASAAHAISTGTVKSVNTDKTEFILTDSAGKDFTYKLGKDVVVNRDGTENSSDLKAADVINVCYDKGKLNWTANYILVNEGAMKDCTLVHGTFKKYDAATKEFTNTETGSKDKIYSMGDAKVRLNMETSKIEDIKSGDTTLAIIKTTGRTTSLNDLMVSRKN
jgi:hypothetical protein